MNNPFRRSSYPFVLSLGVIFVGLVLLSSSWMPRLAIPSTAVVDPAECRPHDFLISVTPSTLEVYRQATIRIQATGPVATSVDQVELSIPDLDFQEIVATEQLKKGVEYSLFPEEIGSFQLEARAGGLRLGGAPILVAKPLELATQSILYKLNAKLLFRPAQSFELAITARSYTRTEEGSELPAPVKKSTTLTVTDMLSADSSLYSLVLPIGEAVSRPLRLQLSPHSHYRLVARGPDNTVHDSLDISWVSHGPHLRLRALPRALSVYATSKTPAHISICFQYDDYRVPPPVPTYVHAVPGSPGVVAKPAGPVKLDTDNPTAHFSFIGASAGEEVQIEFFESVFGNVTKSRVRFLSCTPWFLTAALGGLAGVLVALVFERTNRSSSRERDILLVAFRASTGAVGGGILYFLFLEDILPYPGNHALGFVPAFVSGITGGFSGKLIFELLQSLFLGQRAGTS